MNINRGALVIGALVLTLGGIGLALWKQDVPDNAEAKTPAVVQQADRETTLDDEVATVLPTDTPPADSSQQSSRSTAHTPAPSRSLVITPSSFTVRPGENINLTIQASDGRAINYPHFVVTNDGNFFFNFAASPAKVTWSGPISVNTETP